jgi:hypothetical protein
MSAVNATRPARKTSTTRLVLLVAAMLCIGQTVLAQTRPATRGFVVVNGGYQLATNDFVDGAVKRENAEDGRLDTTYAVASGRAFDVAAGAVLWRGLGIGVGVSRFSVSTPSTLTAGVPHPFFFNRPRPVAAEVTGLTREEQAVHLQLRAVVPAGQRVQLMLFGGPSFFTVHQTMVTDFSYAESYPYDAVTFRAATTTRSTVSAKSFNAGADAAFFFTRQVGIGGTLQFSGATFEMPGALDGTTDVKVGGGQVGAGLRLRF